MKSKIGIWDAKLTFKKDFQGHKLAVIKMPKEFFTNQIELDKWVKDYKKCLPTI